MDIKPISADFLARHDLLWNRVPPDWGSGAFQGNGLMGANIYQQANSSNLRWHIGRTDVYFTAKPDNQYRVPIGDLVWPLPSTPASFNMRLDLWNARVEGILKPDSNTALQWTSFTASSSPVQVIQIKAIDGELPDLQWVPSPAVNARAIWRHETTPADEINPAPIVSQQGAISYCSQSLRDGNEYVTAWIKVPAEKTETYYLTVAFAPAGKARAQAREAIKQAVESGYETLFEAHQKWWHNYWQQNWISLTDTRVESYYEIQLYKLASATRENTTPIDLMGPWYRESPWLKTWWNLNIQLTYWPIYAGNHLELGDPLVRSLDQHRAALAENAAPYQQDSLTIGRTSGPNLISPGGKELCNFPWVLHNYWLQYRYSMDESMLRNRLYPLMKGAANYYIHFLKKGGDGKMHITAGLSPEYQKEGGHADCNIDLALLRWLCQTLIETATKYKKDPALVTKWKSILKNLTPYPVNENGLMVSADTPFDQSHRHYSHLLMMYPLTLMNWENPDDRPLMQKSVDHWLSMPEAFRGFSYTGAAAILSRMGRTEEAEQWLDKWLNDGKIPFPMSPTTMYAEAGPVIETPLSGAATLQEFLLQSWGGKIRVFPSVPKDWPDASFYHMRTEGAFLISACRIDGKTRTIKVESLAGVPCLIQTDMVDLKTDRLIPMHRIASDLYDLSLPAGESVTLFSGSDATPQAITPVTANAKLLNTFGLRP
jgi:hypothetical protein